MHQVAFFCALFKSVTPETIGYLCRVKQVDYLIVGLGLAGIAFSEQCLAHGKSVFVIDSGVAGASRVAAGLYNPVILKRYTLPWRAEEQFDLARTYFKALELKLKVPLRIPLPVRKIFQSIEDQNNWFAASDNPGLKRFMNPNLIQNQIKGLEAPYALGQVNETGRVDIVTLQKAYASYLEQMHAFAKAVFDYSQLELLEDGVVYQEIKAKKIVFAEGYGMRQNPYFNKLPLVGNKGEYIVVWVPGLALDAALKSSFFIVPLGNDCYKVGATYDWTSKDILPTAGAREELIAKFKTVVQLPFKVIDQEVGIRPTTGDRRALIGQHPHYPPLAVLNGLGTRGIMAGPLLAQYLFNHLEHQQSLPPEIDIMRFPKKFG